MPNEVTTALLAILAALEDLERQVARFERAETGSSSTTIRQAREQVLRCLDDYVIAILEERGVEL